jgi:hypothetical protein
LSGQLDQCARLSFPCSLYWIQSSQLIFLLTKKNVRVCVCLVTMNSIILLWVISIKELWCQLHLISDKNLSTVRGWTFAKFFLKSKKNVKCRCIDERKKNLSVLWTRNKCPKKNFQSVEGREKNVSVEFRVFGKKRWKEKKIQVVGEKKSKCFRVKIKVRRFLLSLYSIVGRFIVKHG